MRTMNDHDNGAMTFSTFETAVQKDNNFNTTLDYYISISLTNVTWDTSQISVMTCNMLETTSSGKCDVS